MQKNTKPKHSGKRPQKKRNTGRSGRNRNRGNRSNKPKANAVDYSVYKPKPQKSYGVLFYDTFTEAKAAVEEIKKACEAYDQLNVVVSAEGNMDDEDILSIDDKVKLFAGEAWALIHRRRLEENWYESPH